MKRLATRYVRAQAYLARTHQTIGWAGWGGIGLAVVALMVLASAWPSSEQVAASSPFQPRPATSQVVGGPPISRIKLADPSDVPLLLTLIERAAVDSGLPWANADYRNIPATDASARAVEVRCVFKASYPQLRRMLAQWLATIPSLTFKEFKLSRNSVDAADIEAEFVIDVYLADDPPPASRTRP